MNMPNPSPEPKAAPRRAHTVPRRNETAMAISMSGTRQTLMNDLYVRALDAGWGQILGVYVLAFFSINLIFATLYWLLVALNTGSYIANARGEGFEDYFFFSVQTLATIGYGGMTPHGFLANIIVSLEALSGMGIYALLTGVVFSKFSRPTARVTFSDLAVINGASGGPRRLSFRLVNDRGNGMVNAKISLHMLKDEILPGGERLRRMHDLRLERDHMPVLRLSWVVFHSIDEKSPLWDLTPENMIDNEVELLVSLSGHDETLSSTIHARYSYLPEDIVWDGVFEDLIERLDGGGLRLHYDRLNQLKSGPLA